MASSHAIMAAQEDQLDICQQCQVWASGKSMLMAISSQLHAEDKSLPNLRVATTCKKGVLIPLLKEGIMSSSG